MNIHPITVHFPIAFLTIYALAEIIRVKRLRDSAVWHGVKTVFVGVGFGGALLSLLTGEAAEELVRETALIELHSEWAAASTWIFGVATFIYALILINKFGGVYLLERFGSEQSVGRFFVRMFHIVTVVQRSWFMPLLAIMGLVAITITGGLGGAIVYGPDVDPVVSFIYSLFF